MKKFLVLLMVLSVSFYSNYSANVVYTSYDDSFKIINVDFDDDDLPELINLDFDDDDLPELINLDFDDDNLPELINL